MKQLFFILSGISFITLNTSRSVKFNEDEFRVIECPECTAAYESCTKAIEDAYMETVERASDSISSRTNKVHFSDACAEARAVKNKALSECTTKYNECCLTETKAIMDKEKKEKH